MHLARCLIAGGALAAGTTVVALVGPGDGGASLPRTALPGHDVPPHVRADVAALRRTTDVAPPWPDGDPFTNGM